MVAFDADVLSDIFRGRVDYVQRAATIPRNEQTIPIIVLEEILRGRLNLIRRAEAGRTKVTLVGTSE